MAAFITPTELKNYPLPVTAAQWAKIADDQLEIVIGYASDHLEDYMDRAILSKTYVDNLTRGSGNNRQLLSVYPVISLIGASSYSGGGVETVHSMADFWIRKESGIIEWADLSRYYFSPNLRWHFEYTAGYATVPGPVKHAAALQTVKMLQPMFRGGTNFTETELISELDEQILELLDYYKRRRIG